MALTKAMAEAAGDAGWCIHLGATSNDIVDTAGTLTNVASSNFDGIDSNLVYFPAFYHGDGGSGTKIGTIHVNFGQDATFAGTKTDTAGPYTDANGIGSFYYQPPTGALALCTQNIPTPSVDSAAGDEPEDFFKCSLYTATGSTQSISVGFQPDLVWIKGRDATRVPIISDSVRGITYYIIPSITNGETNISGGVADNLVKSTS